MISTTTTPRASTLAWSGSRSPSTRRAGRSYAYTQSAVAGADILELDVQLTADGALVVQHDDTVDRTTEASGPVSALTLDEIQALDNAYWFVAGFWGDQTRPAEEYVFRGVRTGAVEPPEGFEADDFRVPTFRHRSVS